MITGSNTNVHHRGKLFHVQTEDSGRANPHIISHVYHGGTIIASEKSDYANLAGSENLDSEVRKLIEDQHLVMLNQLKNGEFDAVMDKYLGADSMGKAPSDFAGVVTEPSFGDEEWAASPKGDSKA